MAETKAQLQARINKYQARVKDLDAKIAAIQEKRNLVVGGIATLQAELEKAAE